MNKYSIAMTRTGNVSKVILGIQTGIIILMIFLYQCTYGNVIYYSSIGLMVSIIVSTWCVFRLFGTSRKICITLFLVVFLLTGILSIYSIIAMLLKNHFSLEFFLLACSFNFAGVLRYHTGPLLGGSCFLITISFLILFSGIRIGRNCNITRSELKLVLLISSGIFVLSALYLTSPLINDIEKLFHYHYLFSPGNLSRSDVELMHCSEDNINAQAGLNLVHIFLESVETNYLDEKEFPGLLPNLAKLCKQGICFSNLDMPPNASMTYGGVYASLTGVHLTSLHLRHNVNYNVLIGNKLSTLPKILHKAGYCQIFLYGHNSSFNDFNAFLEEQHFNIIMANNPKSRAEHTFDLSKSDSIRDEVLFERAWEEFKKLSSGAKPFALSLLTIDTHAPNGVCDINNYSYKWKENTSPPTLLHALHNTDQALGRFVSRILSHPAGKKTVIAIQCDHLSHSYTPSVIMKKLERKPRKLLFLIISPEQKPRTVAIPGMTYDIAPTVLHALNVSHNRNFVLGRNLLDPAHRIRTIHDEDGQQQDLIISTLLLYSEQDLKINQYGISFRKTPYPAIKLGTLSLPLLNEKSRSNDLPRGDEIFVLYGSEDFRKYELFNCQNRTEFDKIKLHNKNHWHYCLTCGMNEDGKSFYFRLESDHKVIEKKSRVFDFDAFSPKEIFGWAL